MPTVQIILGDAVIEPMVIMTPAIVMTQRWREVDTTFLHLIRAKRMPIANPMRIAAARPGVITENHISASFPRAISIDVSDTRLPIVRPK